MGEIRKYSLMHIDTEIGVFIEHWSEQGVKLRIELNKSIDLQNLLYRDLAVLQNNYVIDDKGVRFWINNRCTPSTQAGIDSKLKAWGLSEYNQLSIMHRTCGVNFDDRYWIKFNPNFRFNLNHVRGKNFTKIIGMLDGNLIE